MTYRADTARYDSMQYRHCGKSGLKLPVISLGLWQNFGGTRDYPGAMEILGPCVRCRRHPFRPRQ